MKGETLPSQSQKKRHFLNSKTGLNSSSKLTHRLHGIIILPVYGFTSLISFTIVFILSAFMLVTVSLEAADFKSKGEQYI